MKTNKFKILKYLSPIIIVFFVYFIYQISYPHVYKNELIKEFYNNKERPSHNWIGYDEMSQREIFEIYKTRSSIFNPKYSIIQFLSKRTDNGEFLASVDVIKFKRDIFFRIIEDEIVGVGLDIKSKEELVELITNQDISLIKGNEAIRVQTNPTKAEWQKKLEDEKLQPRNVATNPSGTDDITFLISNNFEKNEFIIKSLGKDVRDYGLVFNDFQRIVDGEQFTYWLNDDEFIFLIHNKETRREDLLEITKDYKNGIYKFNVKTKEFTKLIDITEPDKSFDVDYVIENDTITIFTSIGTNTYTKQGDKI